jgi:autotransporter-associated beta strand protein
MIQSRLRTSSRRVFVASLLLAVLPPQGRAQYSLLYSNNFESYTPGTYPFPANPLPGWNAQPSGSGLVPSIAATVNASGQSLNMDGYGGGAAAWMTVNSALLAGVTDWTLSGDARYLASNHTPWYGNGGLLLSSTGDMSGDFLWVGIESGWGEFSPTTTWARPWAQWSLGGVSGGGTQFPPGGAIRMSTDTWGPALLTASRTGGSSDISFVLDSPVDGQRTSTLSFSGAQATALNNLQYVGFADYLSVWQYDNLSASVRTYTWTNGAGDWSDTAHWVGGLVASNGTAVNFSGAGGASTNNNLTSVTGLIFSNGAGSYTVSGNAVTLGAAGIVNNSGNQQTVANDLTLGTSASFTSSSGALVVAGNTALGTNRLTFAATAAMTHSGVISGSGPVVKTGAGTVTLSGNNTYSGALTVSAGVLDLNSSGGSAAGAAASVAVANGATLLVSQGNQVNNSAGVTLSGGTVKTAAGVSEVFGSLNVSTASFLDFGTTSYANANSISFGTYTPSALLTINNFNFGSTLVFKSDLSTSITNSSFFAFSNGGISSYNWDSESSTFTITAIPEPSTCLAAAGLLALLICSSRRRRNPAGPEAAAN